MNITRYEGCTVSGMWVDGVSEHNLCADDKARVVGRVIKEVNLEIMRGNVDLRDLIQLLLPTESHHEDEPCDHCGDYVSTDIWEL